MVKCINFLKKKYPSSFRGLNLKRTNKAKQNCKTRTWRSRWSSDVETCFWKLFPRSTGSCWTWCTWLWLLWFAWWWLPPFEVVEDSLRGTSSAELSSEDPLAWCWCDPPTWSAMGLDTVRSCANEPSISLSTKKVFNQKWKARSPLAHFVSLY